MMAYRKRKPLLLPVDREGAVRGHELVPTRKTCILQGKDSWVK